MRSALPTPAYKHPPRRGDFGGASDDPLGLVAAALDLARGHLPVKSSSPDFGPGLGFDLLDLARMGVDLVTDPMGVLADLAKAGLGELITAIPGRFIDFLDDWGGLLLGGWHLLEQFPVIGRLMSIVRGLATNFIDRIIFQLLGDVSDIYHPKVNPFKCPGALPTSKGQLKFHGFYDAIPNGTEIAKRIMSILQEVLPTVYVFEDDAPALSWEGFDVVATKSRASKQWDIDDRYVTDTGYQHGLPGSKTMYVKAWKLSNRRILVEVGQLRCVSFIGCTRPTSPLVFEHEGDGERFYAHLQVDPTNTMTPTTSEKAVVRLTGLVGTAHDGAFWYRWNQLNAHGDRATLGVARGSHGTSVATGRATMGDAHWYLALVLDYYPGPGDGGAGGSREFVAEDQPAILKHLYESNGDVWGAEKVMGNPYRAWSPGCGLAPEPDGPDFCVVTVDGQPVQTQEETDFLGRIASTFPLDPTQTAPCTRGSPCATCPTPVDLAEDGPRQPKSTPLSTCRPNQTTNDLVA